MSRYQITQIRLTLEPVNIPILSRQNRYHVQIDFTEDYNEINQTQIYLPIKEAAYLWAWFDGIACHPRTNASLLGLSKASKLACLLLQRKDINFTASHQAYQFFKLNCDPPMLRLLLGNDADEIALRLEKNAEYRIIGGYLGGETESKDKARFRAELSRQIDQLELIELLIPQQCKNQRNKRQLNRFCQPLDCLTIRCRWEDL